MSYKLSAECPEDQFLEILHLGPVRESTNGLLFEKEFATMDEVRKYLHSRGGFKLAIKSTDQLMDMFIKEKTLLIDGITVRLEVF